MTFVGRPLGADPWGTLDVCTRFAAAGFAGNDAMLGAKYLMNSGVAEGKPGGMAIGNMYGSTGLYRNECAASSGT